MIHIVAVARLSRAAMSAPVMGDDTEAAIQEKYHLRVPVVSRQRPAMGKHDWLTLSPILEEYRRSVFRADRAHLKVSGVASAAE
jgi:hypothetical protein